MPKVEIPNRLGFFFGSARYKAAYGGRGSAKSWTVARVLIVQSIVKPLRILCAREFQLSIRDSVHRLLCDQIEALGYSSLFEITKTEIRSAAGSEFIFAGLSKNVTKIKSTEGVDICWVEEAETVSEDSWSILIPTIRKEGSEIWITFNPDLESDPTYRRFVLTPPEDAVVTEVSWRDNPWFPETLRKEKDYLYRVDKDAADHIWGGKTRQVGKAQVLAGKVFVDAFEPKPHWNGPYQGVDWGFANDPTVMIRCWVDDSIGKVLYVEHEAYGVGVEITDTPKLFDTIPDARKYSARADKSRPETISHMRSHGFDKMIGASQGPGSVEDGVAHLRGYDKIVVHPRCRHMIDESRLWSYKTDRLSGDVLPVLIDKHNHCIDALRYACEPLMHRRVINVSRPDPNEGYTGPKWNV